MAQKTIVQLTDDIDGGVAGETVQFALDGVTYEIDLNDTNAAALRDVFAPYVKSGRRTGAVSRSRLKASGATYDPKAVRAWASANKVDLPARGRIPTAVLERYRAAGH